jgi:nucleoside-diphosphate-sugar epimerase
VSAGSVLVTGASGFIGSRLARRLSGEGRHARCLVRPTSDTGPLAGLEVELATGTLADEDSLRRAAAGCERVVHCAALVSDWATVAEIRAANVTGTRNVMAAAAAAGVGRVVHISTTDVYGHPGSGPLDESRAPGPFANWYSQTKLEAEAEVSAADVPEKVVIRPATVYGPGSEELVGEIARAIEGGHMLLVDRGRGLAGLCYVENLIDAIVLALEEPLAAGATFNVADGVPVTWAAFAGDLANGLGAPPVRLSLPYPLAAAAAFALEHGYRLVRTATGLQTPPLLSRQAVQVLGRDQSFSAARAEELLGWRPRVDYAAGLEATLGWLRERPRRTPRGEAPGQGAAVGLNGAGAGL